MIRNYGKTIRKFEKHKSRKRRFKDVAKWYSNKKAVDKELKKNRNKVIYETFTEKDSPMDLTLTVIHPGVVGKEYHMTKGHVHGANNPEFYILLEGNGKLLIQKTREKPKTIILKKGKIALIPKGYAHRLINPGRKKLKVLTIYSENSRPNYNVKFKKRFFRK